MTINDLFCTPEQGRRLKELVPELTCAMVWEFCNWKKLYSEYPLYLDDYVDKIKRAKYKNLDAIIDHAFRKAGYIAPALTLQELRDAVEKWNTARLETEDRLMMNATDIFEFEDMVIGSTAPELAAWVIKRLEEEHLDDNTQSDIEEVESEKEEKIEIKEPEGEAVTKWYVWNEMDCEWKYNHYENGHSERSSPKAKTPKQRDAWAKADWLGKHAYMKQGKIDDE